MQTVSLKWKVSNNKDLDCNYEVSEINYLKLGVPFHTSWNFLLKALFWRRKITNSIKRYISIIRHCYVAHSAYQISSLVNHSYSVNWNLEFTDLELLRYLS